MFWGPRPDERALPLSQRLERYRDTEASIAAIATSGNGLELYHTKIPGVFALVFISFGAVLLLLALSGIFSETAGRVFVVGAAMFTGAAFLPLFTSTARQFAALFSIFWPLVFLDISVAFLLDGLATQDLFFCVFWAPLFSAFCLVLLFRPGWYLRAITWITLLGWVAVPPLQCIASANREASSYGECVATGYRTWAPIIGVFGVMSLDQLAQTLAKHTMARRALKASRGLHRL